MAEPSASGEQSLRIHPEGAPLVAAQDGEGEGGAVVRGIGVCGLKLQEAAAYGDAFLEKEKERGERSQGSVKFLFLSQRVQGFKGLYLDPVLFRMSALRSHECDLRLE